ncbi:hypothetical protein [Labrys wisconsinensis]|uniref:Tfp pilus assembly protein PilN n=1 Tax=Labrys wisconsinensis TaxID=425677 RepID=A0ABU0JGW8_9HYPH|nr:hypothetical protein [Labrys wisconsinensis]MDQ0473528.1 Tfp pilus assembly protein PilN [Labrys wisconsinensis]
MTLAGLSLRLRYGLALWHEALRAGAPAWLRPLFGSGRRVELVCAPAPQLRQVAADGDVHPVEARRLGRKARQDVVLVPPDDIVLRRSMELPRGALADLDAVVRLDMPISTPFRPDEVVFAAAPRGAAGPGRARVEVAMATRQALAPWLERAEALAVRPARIRFGEGLVADLDPAAASRRRDGLRLDGLLLLLAVTLAGSLAMVTAWQRQDMRAGLRAALAGETDALSRVQALRLEIERRHRLAAFVPDQRRAATRAVDLLGRIAAQLPAEIRLDSLSLDGSRLSLVLAARPDQDLAGQAQHLGNALFETGYTVSDKGGMTELTGIIAGAGARP